MAKKQPAVGKQPAVKATVTVKELRDKSLEVLTDDLMAVRKDLADARRSLAAGELVNPRVIRLFKKSIARIETLRLQKAREASKGKED